MEYMIEKFLHQLQKEHFYKKQIVHKQIISPQKPHFGKLDLPLPERLQDYLTKNQICLLSHQAEAINEIRKSQNLVIVTHRFGKNPDI